MGYTTKFSGQVNLSRPLTLSEARQLMEFNDDPDGIPNPAVKSGYMQWVPSKTLDSIGWDGGEKFYDYEAWLKWICAWLQERGISTNGKLLWSGEDRNDTGSLTVADGVVTALKGDKVTGKFVPLTMADLGRMALDQVAKGA